MVYRLDGGPSNEIITSYQLRLLLCLAFTLLFLCCILPRLRLIFDNTRQLVLVKDDPDAERAAWARGNVLAVVKLFEGDAKLVATRTGIRVHLEFGVEVKVLNLHLLVDAHLAGRVGGWGGGRGVRGRR